jgi:hypothetical protein
MPQTWFEQVLSVQRRIFWSNQKQMWAIGHRAFPDLRIYIPHSLSSLAAKIFRILDDSEFCWYQASALCLTPMVGLAATTWNVNHPPPTRSGSALHFRLAHRDKTKYVRIRPKKSLPTLWDTAQAWLEHHHWTFHSWISTWISLAVWFCSTTKKLDGSGPIRTDFFCLMERTDTPSYQRQMWTIHHWAFPFPISSWI